MIARRAVPHTRRFLADTLTPLGVYQRLSRLSPWRFLFESVTGGEQVSRYSFLGAAPRAVYRLYADRLEEEDADGRRSLPGPPLEALARLTAGIRAEPGPLPFTGGFVGYFGYDLVRLVERLPDRPPDPFGLPLARLARFDRIVVFDHAHQRLLAVANEIEGAGQPRAGRGGAGRAGGAARGRRRERRRGPRRRPAGAGRRRAARSRAPTTAPPCGKRRSRSPPATSSRRCWRGAGGSGPRSSRWPSTGLCG